MRDNSRRTGTSSRSSRALDAGQKKTTRYSRLSAAVSMGIRRGPRGPKDSPGMQGGSFAPGRFPGRPGGLLRARNATRRPVPPHLTHQEGPPRGACPVPS
ncbi:hypothetical protein ASNO1_54890 [Corallococcus caeni]|uniref:Uncharacterized protein n=1 Tax=Corallococcus caeni TaxID=3082388 RepID=A0ABQ6QZ12_9BACT|nr:hypothetical protein ASNO1_54890 [Corallococcus sp. NO1]